MQELTIVHEDSGPQLETKLCFGRDEEPITTAAQRRYDGLVQKHFTTEAGKLAELSRLKKLRRDATKAASALAKLETEPPAAQKSKSESGEAIAEAALRQQQAERAHEERLATTKQGVEILLRQVRQAETETRELLRTNFTAAMRLVIAESEELEAAAKARLAESLATLNELAEIDRARQLAVWEVSRHLAIEAIIDATNVN